MSLQNRPTLLLLHGGYWRKKHGPEHLTPLAAALENAGWEVSNPEYVRKPGDPYATIVDIKGLLESYKSKDLIIVGFSAGGQFSLLLASQFPNIKAIVALAPVTDLLKTEEFGLGENATSEWLPKAAVNYPDLDPARSEFPRIPTTIIHGSLDVRVPIALSQNYVNLAFKSGIQIDLIEILRIGHFEIIDPKSIAFNEVLKALNTHTSN